MTQKLNQFAQSTEKGVLDLALNPNKLSCRIDPDVVKDHFPGTPVTLNDVSGKILQVSKAALNTDDIMGFIVYSVKNTAPVPGDFVEVGISGTVMQMEASAAIARGAAVEVVITGDKVATLAAGTSIGKALDKADADGDLIRVLIKTTY